VVSICNISVYDLLLFEDSLFRHICIGNQPAPGPDVVVILMWRD